MSCRSACKKEVCGKIFYRASELCHCRLHFVCRERPVCSFALYRKVAEQQAACLRLEKQLESRGGDWVQRWMKMQVHIELLASIGQRLANVRELVGAKGLLSEPFVRDLCDVELQIVEELLQRPCVSCCSHSDAVLIGRVDVNLHRDGEGLMLERSVRNVQVWLVAGIPGWSKAGSVPLQYASSNSCIKRPTSPLGVRPRHTRRRCSQAPAPGPGRAAHREPWMWQVGIQERRKYEWRQRNECSQGARSCKVAGHSAVAGKLCFMAWRPAVRAFRKL